MGLGVLVIANDFTALNVALPAMEQDFDVDVGTIQWTVNAYALVFGMGLVTGGRLADMLGRRKIFFIGTAIFAGFSLLGAIAPNAPLLIGARVGMGVGGALMWPAILGMTFAALPAERAALAGGLILGIAGLGNALGPLIGGVLTDEFSWRAIFWLNLPIAAFAALATAKFVHEPPVEADERKIDYPGIATVSGGLVALLLGLDQAVDWGWTDVRVLGHVRARRRPARRLPRGRAPRRRGGADPAGRDREPGLPRRLPDGADALGRLLLDRPLRAAAHGEDPRLLGPEGGVRDAADARPVRARRLLHAAASTTVSAAAR